MMRGTNADKAMSSHVINRQVKARMSRVYDERGGEWRGWVTPDGQLKFETPEGDIIRVRGYLKGPAGGPPSVETIARAVLAYFEKYPVRVPADGKRGENGKDGERGPAGPTGRAPTYKEVHDAVADFLKANPIPTPKDGERGEAGPAGERGAAGAKGDPGADGALGPMPRHELDPPENPHRVRFEVERAKNGSVKRWGDWLDIRSMLPKVMAQQTPKAAAPRQLGGAPNISEARIIELIEEFGMDSGEQDYMTAKATVTAAGDTTVLTPTTGKRLVVRKIYAVNNPASGTPALIKIKLLNDAGIEEWIRNYGISTRQKRVGAVNQPLVINLDVPGSVAVTVFYEEE